MSKELVAGNTPHRADGYVPLAYDPRPLRVSEERQLREPRLRVCNRPREQGLEVIAQAEDGGLVEQVGVVLERPAETLARVDEVEAQLVGRRPPLPDHSRRTR